MHELSLATALVEQLEEAAHREHVKKIYSVTVRIGALSGVEVDAFELAYPVASEGTLLEGSSLIIEFEPVVIKCDQCTKESTIDLPNIICMHCESTQVRVIAGKEMYIKQMEVS